LGDQFQNSPGAFEARTEERDESAQDWIRETVTVDSSYDDAPFRILIFLPRSAEPPFQTVVLYPGADAIFQGDREEMEDIPSYLPVTFLPRSGRAVVFPIYRGTFERAKTRHIHAEGNFVFGGKDLERTLQYLKTREDIDSDRLAYMGFSMGAIYGAAYLPYRPEFKTAIFVSGGMADFSQGDQIHMSGLLPHITIPVLMLNGKFDYLFPPASSQEPFFELLGTSDEQKRRVVYDSGHWPLPRNELIRETLDWLDKYLGTVERPQPEVAEAAP
jgi:dipeptidyl aminopeptidase/acylaminoacyl peptidase